MAAVIRKYPQKFTTAGDDLLMPYENLADLPPDDLRILRRADLQGLGMIVLLFLLVVILDFVLNFFQKVIMEYTGHMIMHDLRMKLYNHLQRLSMSFFTRNPVGRLVTRVTNDVQNMHELFTSIVALIFKDLFLFVGITIVLVSMHWPADLDYFLRGTAYFVLGAALFASGKGGLSC